MMQRVFDAARWVLTGATGRRALPSLSSADLLLNIRSSIQSKQALIVARGNAAEISRAVDLFREHGQNCDIFDLDEYSNEGEKDDLQRLLFTLTGRSKLPLIYVKGDCIGGVSELNALHSKGILKEWLTEHEFDLVVLGGGSGGLAAAKEASILGKKVAVLDFVKPSPQGSTWGIGGTCVNVGCIPKKLMHHAALLGHFMSDARYYGWQFDKNVSNDWETLKTAVQNHIKSLNWLSRVDLREKKVKYINAYGKFVGSHRIQAIDKAGKEQYLTADRVLIATGLRPRYPNAPGMKEHCITSDDIFSLSYNPGKTLVVGASYVALECAGFLRGLGNDVTVMVRSILLRGFDRGMSEKIGQHMETLGIKFIYETVPTEVTRLEDGEPGLLQVVAKSKNGEIITEEYNTVLLAMGRDATTDDLGLEIADVKLNPNNNKVICHSNEQSVTAPHIYAMGDVLEGGIELTPVAIVAGRLWARRLFGNSNLMFEYINVPTTVFTPLEYGCCGMTEEQAYEKFGEENVEVFHMQYEPVEFKIPKRKDSEFCYMKMICNKLDDMRVLGMHVIGPSAGEMMQGFGMVLVMKATKADVERLVGIHPTCAELFTTLSITKSSGQDYMQGQCCS